MNKKYHKKYNYVIYKVRSELIYIFKKYFERNILNIYMIIKRL